MLKGNRFSFELDTKLVGRDTYLVRDVILRRHGALGITREKVRLSEHLSELGLSGTRSVWSSLTR